MTSIPLQEIPSAQLDSLPSTSVIRDADGEIALRADNSATWRGYFDEKEFHCWRVLGDDRYDDGDVKLQQSNYFMGPIQLLWHPDWGIK
jgi:hypothetical protein